MRTSFVCLILFTGLIFLCGCPKQNVKSLEELEKERQLQELLEEEDEIFDDLPEAGEEDEPENSKRAH